jgi:hypothetical protein
MTEPFLKLMKNKETMELATNAPNAFLLLLQIAWRAKRTNDFNAHGLTIGQALVGDYKSIGLTEQRYRTAKGLLETWGFATFKGTNKGTVANLINSRVFDINEEGKGRAKGRSRDEQETTNKKYKKEKNTDRTVCPYESIVGLFNSMLPDLPHVDLITDERKKTIKARWMTSDKTQSLDWWKEFFSHVGQSDFLMGRAKDSFCASFDWITKKSNFVKIIEGNYHK